MISSYVTPDWLTITIILMVVLLAYMRHSYDERFDKFISIVKSNEYFVEYFDKKAPFMSVFNILLFFFQLGVYTLLIFFIKRFINSSESGIPYNSTYQLLRCTPCRLSDYRNSPTIRVEHQNHSSNLDPDLKSLYLCQMFV